MLNGTQGFKILGRKNETTLNEAILNKNLLYLDFQVSFIYRSRTYLIAVSPESRTFRGLASWPAEKK